MTRGRSRKGRGWGGQLVQRPGGRVCPVRLRNIEEAVSEGENDQR